MATEEIFQLECKNCRKPYRGPLIEPLLCAECKENLTKSKQDSFIVMKIIPKDSESHSINDTNPIKAPSNVNVGVGSHTINKVVHNKLNQAINNSDNSLKKADDTSLKSLEKRVSVLEAKFSRLLNSLENLVVLLGDDKTKN